MHRQKANMNKDILTELSLQKEPHGRRRWRQATQEEYRDVT